MYTGAQIETILSGALTTIYRLQNQVERERYMQGDDRLANQPPIIYSLYNAVNWAYNKGLTTDEFYGLAAYLYSKCEKEVAYLSGITYSGSGPIGVIPDSGRTNYWEFYVSAVPASGYPAAGDTEWVEEDFVNRSLDVEYGGLPVPGVETTDGSMYFLKPYSSNTLTFYNLPGGLNEGALLKVRAWAAES